MVCATSSALPGRPISDAEAAFLREPGSSF